LSEALGAHFVDRGFDIRRKQDLPVAFRNGLPQLLAAICSLSGVALQVLLHFFGKLRRVMRKQKDVSERSTFHSQHHSREPRPTANCQRAQKSRETPIEPTKIPKSVWPADFNIVVLQGVYFESQK
jgi:hypothetical protein